MTDQTPEPPPQPTEADQLADTVHTLQTIVNRVSEAVAVDEPAPAPADSPLRQRIAEALAEKFTAPHRGGQPASERLDQGMMRHFIVDDGYPAMAPVTPADAADAALAVVQPELDRLQRAIDNVRRFNQITADISCRVQAIEQARDTLEILAAALQPPADATEEQP
jgi:hypothetical protein